MNTLSIGNNTEKLDYAIYFEKLLEKYGNINIDNLETFYNDFYKLVKDNKIAWVIAIATDFDKTKRQTALHILKIRTVVKLVCEQLGVIYTTPSTYGWDKYFYGDKIQPKKLEREKVKIANEIFSIGLSENDNEIANAIMLGWTFVNNHYKVYKRGAYDL